MNTLALFVFATFGFFGTSEKPAGFVEDTMPSVPEMNIRRRFGEKTFLRVVLDPASDIPYARLKLGFAPWAAGADGVVCDLGEAFAQARAGAAADVRLLDQMRDLQTRALKETDPDRRMAGRKLGAFLVNLDVTGDPDLLHLEALARLNAAEKTLGLPLTPLTPVVSAKPAPPSARKPPRAPSPEMEKWTKAELAVNQPVTFAPGLSVTWYNGHLLRFYVTNLGQCAKDAAGWPGGRVTIRLWVPDARAATWLAYEVDYSLEKEPGETRTVWKSTRLWGRAYPFPLSASGHMDAQTAGGRFEWTFVPGDFFDQRPGLKPRVRDSWFAEVRHTDAKGAVRTGEVRVVWPAGGPDSELAAGDSLPFETYQTKVKPLYESLRQRWEGHEDERFYRDFVSVVLAADAKLLEKIYTNCGSLPPIKNEVPAVRLKFYRELPRIVFIEERLTELRKAYLKDVLAGRDPKPPQLTPPTEEKRGTSAPTLDEGEGLDLDEEVF